jgi:hypothetical protein
MERVLFIRNIRAREQLEIFIVSSVSSLLLLRYYLYLTGYPQVGGSLHIAHMLYGGLLMMAALVCMLAFLGRRMQRLCALLGGIGFGIFIDEIGKFITKDNNYFFRPAVGIIYAIFVLLYILLTLLTRTRHLTSTEYQLNALAQLEEVVLRKMDTQEKASVVALLQQADPHSPITRHLQSFISEVKVLKSGKPNLVKRWAIAGNAWYERLWQARSSNAAVRGFFIFVTYFFLSAVTYPIANNLDNINEFFTGQVNYGHSLVIGQLISTILAGVLAAIGIIRLKDSRVDAFEWFRRSVIVDLLLTEFFVFSRIQFEAMVSFIPTLALLILINYVLDHERRVRPLE